MSDERLLRFALAYTAHGWPVLPLHAPTGGLSCDCGRDCGSPAKHPRTRNGLKDATTDANQVAEWWSAWPTANIGIALPDNLLVADFDTETPNAVVPELEGNTAISKTGRGWHFWYSLIGGPAIRPAVGVLPHLDVRAFGSYIVAPPSRHANGNVYSWLVTPKEALEPVPEWLRRLTQSPVRERAVTMAIRERATMTADVAVERLETLAQAVAKAPVGQRNAVTFWAACRALEEGQPPEVAERVLFRAAMAAGLTEHETLATLRSARQRVPVG